MRRPISRAICISYLSLDVFERRFCQSDDEFEERLLSNRLFESAARNWGHHARKASTLSQVLSQVIVNCLTSKLEVNALSQGLLAIKRYSSHSNYSQQVGRGMIGLHLIAHLGFRLSSSCYALDASAARCRLEGRRWSDAAVLGYRERARGRRQATARYRQVDADSKDKYGQTPLLWAAANGHEAVVKLLLDTGKVDADSKDKMVGRRCPGLLNTGTRPSSSCWASMLIIYSSVLYSLYNFFNKERLEEVTFIY